jgi:photosystem II stability/assembly factor-like uncharacterized protein
MPTAFPALERLALPVREPARSVLLAVARAGDRLVACGERGVVVLSDDNGETWRQAAAVPCSVTLTALRFVDARTGWAVGHGGVILHTSDGGKNWQKQVDGETLAASAASSAAASGDATQQRAAQHLQSQGADKPLLDVHFQNKDRGWVVGAYGLCFETRDGGRNWTSLMGRLRNPKDLHLYTIHAEGEALIIAGEQGLLLKSRDAGQAFNPLPSPYAGSWFTLAALGQDRLVAAGLRGNVFVSKDQGDTWTAVAGAPAASITACASGPDTTLYFVNQAGQVMVRQGDGPIRMLDVPPLAPLAGIVALANGALVTVGMAGAVRLPSPKAPQRGNP